MGRFKMPPQILRLVLLTLGILGSYSVARALLTPASFHQYGWFRGAALQEIAAREPIFAGRKACSECHDDIAQKLARAEHRTISCESCHGPGRAHGDNPDQKMNKPGDALCLRCHQANPARPAWLKQIDPSTHYHGDKCIGCHVPHQPNEVP